MQSADVSVGVVIPTLNEEKVLGDNLTALLKDEALSRIVVADGGSADGTPAIVDSFVQRHPGRIVWTSSAAGRGRQMNVGAACVECDWVVFHHADSFLPHTAGEIIRKLPADVQWGGFSHRFYPGNAKLSFISALHNLRCRLSGVVYGDQSMFVRQSFFAELGGFDENGLEDLLFSDRALTRSKSVLLKERVLTDSRKFRQIGELRALAQTVSIVLRYERGKQIGHERFFTDYR